MTDRRPDDIRKAIDSELSGVGRDPFLYHRILNTAKEETPPRRRSRKLTAALVLLAALMLSTAAAVAGNWLGVRYFLTERLAVPVPVEDAYVVYPVSQSFDSERISLRVLDAYWFDNNVGDSLNMTLHADVKDTGKAFCMDTDIGNDGESFELIWLNRTTRPVADWLAGRDGYVLCLWGKTRINGEPYWGGIDWVHEEQGVTIAIGLRDAPDMTNGATLTMEGWSYPIVPDDSELGYSILRDEMETFTLTVTLPPMTRGPARDIDWTNEPNA